MSKYDFEVDLSQNSSTGIILSKIPRGASVLEFGCAAGRMTRYMKQVLDCQVYIVEYDQRDYETALEYAQEGLCDDIMQFRWVQRFRERKFDAIIFADVLEHLTAPGEVLKRAAALLKDDGRLYISIPNVTHNDVLLKAYGEHFDYTPTGLLDDTHIHFWGMENLGELAAACGLSIQSMEGTHCPTGYTEQWDQTGERNLLLENILRERQCGEVYQFVLTLGRDGAPGQPCRFKAATIQSHVYLDTGNNFNPDESVMVEAEYSGQGSYRVRYAIADAHKLCRVRFDPVEGQGCILRRMEISQGGEPLELICPGGVETPSGWFLSGDDPMVYTQTQPDAGAVVIDADIVLAGGLFQELLQEAYADKHDETVRLSRQRAELQGERERLQGCVNGLEDTQRQLQDHIGGLTEEKAVLEQDLAGYISLARQKDLYSLKLERDVTGLTAQNQELRSQLEYYRNLKVVRVRAFFARIVKGLFRRLKRLVRKEEHG